MRIFFNQTLLTPFNCKFIALVLCRFEFLINWILH